LLCVIPDNLPALEGDEKRLLQVGWDLAKKDYSVEIKVNAKDQPGVLPSILNVFEKAKVAINSTNAKVNPNSTATCTFNVKIKNLGQLEELIKKVKQLPAVFSVERSYDYTAGQYTLLEFTHRGHHHKKPFTISNSPTREHVEFTTTITDSDYKQALDALPIGSEAEVCQPMGSFTLDARRSSRLVFLVGGIGVTPVRSILQYLADTGEVDELDIWLFYSNRNEERIVFRRELDELSEKIGRVGIVHTLTHLSKKDGRRWGGETGYISAEMTQRHIEDLNSCTFYVVGPPAFNTAMEEIVTRELGVLQEMVVKETFSGY